MGCQESFCLGLKCDFLDLTAHDGHCGWCEQIDADSQARAINRAFTMGWTRVKLTAVMYSIEADKWFCPKHSQEMVVQALGEGHPISRQLTDVLRVLAEETD